MKLLWAGIAAAVTLALPAGAHATTYGVDRVADTPAGQDCDTRPGDCSLREAVTSANANPGTDVINVVGGRTYPLTQGQLTVTDELTIQRIGAGAAVLDVDGAFRAVSAVAVPLTITGFTIRDGTPAGATVTGGAIEATGPLTLDRVVVTASTAGGTTSAAGGGIHATGASLTITSSTVSANTAVGGTAAGGGIWTGTGTTVSLTDTTITGNTADGTTAATGGGALLSRASALLRTSVTGNAATVDGGSPSNVARGGGLATRAGLTADASRISGNTLAAGPGVARGSGIDHEPSGGAAAGVTRSRIDGNTATGRQAVGGGVATTSGFDVTASTVDGNTVTATAPSGMARAGGLYGDPGALTLVNATLHGNVAAAGAANATAAGGGLYALGSGTSLLGSTVTANRVEGVAGAGTVAGGGVASFGPGLELTATGSVISGNAQPVGADCAEATLDSGGGNVVDTAGTPGCVFFPAGGDLQSDAPLLEGLGDHGGAVPTARPQAGSPVLDRAGGGCPAEDVRGVVRPQGTACDAGAFEARAATLDPSATTRAFGDVEAATTSPPQTVTFTNAGDLPATPALALAGADPSVFTLAGCTGTVAPGATCTATLRFAPTDVGARSATLTGGSGDVTLTGRGTLPAPACTAVTRTTAYETAVDVPLSCTWSPDAWAIAAPPARGTLGPAGATVRYTPEAGFSGTDSFTYTATNAAGTSAPATVTITVGAKPVVVDPGRPADDGKPSSQGGGGQQQASPSGDAQPSAAAPAAPRPACRSRRRFTLRLNHGDVRLRSVRVALGDRALPVRRKGTRWTVVVDLRGRPSGTVRLRIVGRTAGGRALRVTKRYRTCAR